MIASLTWWSSAAIWIVIIGCPTRRHGRGIHVSRPLGRRLGLVKVKLHLAQVVLLNVEIVFWIVGINLAALIGQVLYVAWVADDWITGEDDDRDDRKHEWAKVKLRMRYWVTLKSWQFRYELRR